MKQKKIGTTLYVFDTTAYQITEDTDATVIKIQEECIPAYAKLNPTLVSKFSPINYKLYCVQKPEWADYLDDYTVSISVTGNGAVSASPTSADEGEEITLTVTPESGYELNTLTAASGGTAITITDNKFTMPAGNVTVTATFQGQEFNITCAETQNGTLGNDHGNAARLGDTVIIYATPDTNYVLDTLTVMCGDVPVTVTNNAFTMPAGDVTITATFVSSGVVIHPKWYKNNEVDEYTSPIVWSTQDYIGLNLRDVDLNIGVTDERGSSLHSGSLVAIWESSDTSVITIEGGSSDALLLVATQAEGTAIVTATWPAQTVNGVLYAGGSASITINVQ